MIFLIMAIGQVNDREEIYFVDIDWHVYISQLCQFDGLQNLRNALFCLLFFANKIYYNLIVRAGADGSIRSIALSFNINIKRLLLFSA